MEEQKLREEIARFMRRLYERGLTTSSGGNVSARFDDETILITPSGTDKAQIESADVISMPASGDPPQGGPAVSMEFRMHRSIYGKCPEAGAVVHAHPLFATGYAAAGREIRFDLTAEPRLICGAPVTVPFDMMGSPELAGSVSDAACGAKVILMMNHGAVTVGESLLQAFNRMELLEEAAKMTFITEMLGGAKGLTNSEIEMIERLAGDLSGRDQDEK